MEIITWIGKPVFTESMTDIANKVYGRNYSSVSRVNGKNGEVLEFVGIGVRTSVLEREFEFHIKREVESRRNRGNNKEND